MKYNVLNTFVVGSDTAVTIEGNGNGLANNMNIKNESDISYVLKSVAMVENENPSDFQMTTTLLIDGIFEGQEIYKI